MTVTRLLSYFLLVLSVLLSACSSVEKAAVFEGPLMWPQPPAQPRFKYEFVLSAPSDIVKPTEDAKLRESLTGIEAVSHKPFLDKPSAIVVRNGRVYVADTGTASIAVFDIPRRKVFRFGLREPFKLTKPAGVALDKDMNVFVADASQRKVMAFDSLGLYIGAVGSPEDLVRPTGVALSPDGERIYVVDRATNESDQHDVVVYDRKGKKLQVIGKRGTGDGEFNIPTQATVGTDGSLYVLDAGNFRVQVFDTDGKFLRKFGSLGKDYGQFARPRGIAVDSEGNVYVTDASFNNFQIFNPKGELLLAIGETGAISNPGEYGMLNGIAVDETDHVYIVDQVYNKVEVLRRLSDEEGKELVAKAKK